MLIGIKAILLFIGIIVLILIVMALGFLNDIVRWRYDRLKPIQKVYAKVISKKPGRLEANPNDRELSSIALNSVSFDVGIGEVLELAVDDFEYANLNEGDIGEVTFQGTRFLDFIPVDVIRTASLSE